ncbi:MAG: hypothetical protein L3J69_05870 [Desulfobacula sp.]|nr:hypothetical protein [Desulfobacula sp.]
MKLIKYLFWLIIVCILGTLVYQNLEYFMTSTALHLDLKIVDTWNWTVPELQNSVYFAICFGLGLLLTGYKALAIKFRLNKKIKFQNKQITGLKERVNTLKTELEVFQHDPYIKKSLIAPDTPTQNA